MRQEEQENLEYIESDSDLYEYEAEQEQSGLNPNNRLMSQETSDYLKELLEQISDDDSNKE